MEANTGFLEWHYPLRMKHFYLTSLLYWTSILRVNSILLPVAEWERSNAIDCHHVSVLILQERITLLGLSFSLGCWQTVHSGAEQLDNL